MELPPRLVVFHLLSREHVFVSFVLSCNIVGLRFDSDSFFWNLLARTRSCLYRFRRLGQTGLSRRHRELVNSVTLVQIGWATGLWSVPREGICHRVVAGRMCSGDARYKIVLWTHQTFSTKLFVVPSLMSKNPSQSNPVFIHNVCADCFFPFRTRQMYTSSPNWNSTCFRFRLRSCFQGSTVRTCLQNTLSLHPF